MEISIVSSFDGCPGVAVEGDVDAAIKAMEERFGIQLYDKTLHTPKDPVIRKPEGPYSRKEQVKFPEKVCPLDFPLMIPWYYCRFVRWEEDSLEPDGDFVIYSMTLGDFSNY